MQKVAPENSSARAAGDDVPLRTAAAFAAGLFLGAALGVLLAPVPGRKSREWVVTRGREVGRRVTPLFHPHEVSKIIRTRGVRGLWEVLQHRSGHENGQADTPAASFPRA